MGLKEKLMGKAVQGSVSKGIDDLKKIFESMHAYLEHMSFIEQELLIELKIQGHAGMGIKISEEVIRDEVKELVRKNWDQINNTS